MPSLILPQALPRSGLPVELDMEPSPMRRRILAAGAASLFLNSPLTLASNFWDEPRQLDLYRAQTRERVDTVYWKNGNLNYEGYYKACQLLRDTHENKAVQMDLALLDILCGVQGYYKAYGYDYPIVIHSGFRTVKTNNSLRSEGAARNSMHLYGRAADLHMPAISARHLGLVGLYFRSGGVGFYESKSFIHLDTGRVRVWRG